MMQNPSPSHYNLPSPYGNVPSPASSIGSTIYDVNVRSPDTFIGSPSANQPRQRLRPWLIDQINEAKTPGLDWVDKEQMMFKIPWKHFGRPGVDEYNDAMLFRNWALHTKKWQEGQPTDISTWKTRFRCALTKLQDIAELGHMHQTEGEEPYRVYQFKKKGNEDNNTPRNNFQNNVTIQDGNPPAMFPGGYRDPSAGQYSPAVQFPDLDAAQFSPDVVDIDLPGIDSIDDLDNIIQGDSDFNPSSQANSQGMVGNVVNNPMQHHQQQQQQHHQMQNNAPVLATLHPASSQNSLTAIRIKLFYEGQEMGEQIVDNPRGLRIAFNPPPPLPEDVVRQEASEVVSHIYGPFQAEQIYFPPSQKQRTMGILEMTKRGLVLQSRGGEILATRLCRAKVFYSDSLTPAQHPKELPREHTTAIFDYTNDFLPKFKLYMQGQGPLPSAERYFSFAQRCSSQLPMSSILVYVSVAHALAQRQVNQVQAQRSGDILVSEPNVLDHIANQIEELSINQAGMPK